MPRSSTRFTSLLAGALALACAASGRADEETRIAILGFNGPAKEAQKAQAALDKALGKKFELVPQALWDESGAKLVAGSRSADDIAAVAKDLKVKVVLTGAIKNDGGWQLVVTIRNGPTGKPVEKQRYPLKGPKIDAATLQQMVGEVVPLVDKAAGGATAEKPDEQPAAPPPKGSTEEESPLAAKKKTDETENETPAQPRPLWAPFIDGSAGFLLSGRGFSFDPPVSATSPQFRSSVSPGLRLDVTGFPLALLARRTGAGINALTGLGVGATADFVFWPASVPRDQSVDTCGGPAPCSFATSELRIEAGLRWHWNVLNRPRGPELLVSFEWGLHTFTIAKRPDGTEAAGVPDVAYNYLTAAVGGRIPLIDQLAIVASFHWHFVLDSGAIRSQDFGAGFTYGLRASLGVELRPWRGLMLRLAGFYERFGLGFNNTGRLLTAAGATDQYYGGWLNVGYVF